MEMQEIREFMLVGRVLSKTADAIEIEITAGLVAVLNPKAALKIEEYTDPSTGIGVANIFFKADADIAAALRPRAQDLLIRDTRVPFILVDPPIAASAPGGEMAGTPVVSKTKSCYKTNETTGDCGPDDPAPKLTAGYF
jgi:hypothetical protein